MCPFALAVSGKEVYEDVIRKIFSSLFWANDSAEINEQQNRRRYFIL
jgi:hypothetical protein